MVYYKFYYNLDFEYLIKERPKFNLLYKPKDPDEDNYCYAEIDEDDFEDFIHLFNVGSHVISEEDPEWPGSVESFSSGRIRRFTIIEHLL